MPETSVAAPPNLYEQVAGRIADLIAQGTLRPGERIPSVRRLSRQQSVSITTILEAYRLLEDRGLIEARPQSGHYVRVLPLSSPAEPEATQPRGGPARVQIDDLVMRVLRSIGQPGFVDLGAASPAPELLPSDKLHRAMAAAARRLTTRGNQYCAPPGLKALRVQIARRTLDAGCSLAPDDFVVTCGAQEALSLALRAVCEPGDAVALESPTYFGVLQALELFGLKAVEIATHPRDGIDLRALRKVLRDMPIKAVAVAPSFSNPLGSCMPDAHKEELVALLARKGIPLVEDDTFGDLPFGPHRPRVAKAFDRTGNVLLCSSFSKTLAPGYRVGWIAGGRFQERVERLKFVTNVTTPTLPQYAIAEVLANGGYDRHLRKVRRVYAQQMDLMTAAIARHFPAGTRATRPAGGFVLWVELPRRVDSLALFERARKAGITLVPGPLFSPKQGFRNFIRLNAAYWSPEVEAALRLLGSLATELEEG